MEKTNFDARLLTPLANGLPATVPFVGPEAQERSAGKPFKARLGANENVFGAAPTVLRTLRENAHLIWQYADPESADLRAAIAAHHNVKAENVVVDCGIDTLLGVLVRLTVGQGDPVVTSLGAYPTFNFHVNGFGGQTHQVPYRDDFEDTDTLICKAREVGAKLIYLANPDNPMGTAHKAEVIQEMILNLPPDTMLVLDEAYVELAQDDCIAPLDMDNPRVIRMRTFSKAYGMAGARVGYALGHPDMIRAFEKVRNHFGMNKLSQMAALAAINDQAYLHKVVDQIKQARIRIGAIGAAHGLLAIPSSTNFVTLDCGRDGNYARAVLAGLVAQGVFVRMPFVSPQDRCIRVSAGRDADLDLFEQALPAALAAAG